VSGPVRPEPVPDRLTRPYWEHARQGRLAFQRCASCGRFQHPPGPVCRSCGGRELEFQPVSGRGTVYTYTVTHHRVVPGFDEVPYAVALVEMDEQPGLRVLSNILGVGPEAVHVGLAVEVCFEDLPGGLKLPQFRPRS
jgi:uncharacterized OB-fold protein